MQEHPTLASSLPDPAGDQDDVQGTFKDLCDALDKGCERLIKKLLVSGVDCNERTPDGQLLIHWATASGRESILSMFLDHGADIDALTSDSEAAIHIGVSERNLGMVQLLLERGAEINIKTGHQETPLFIATSEKHTGIAALLLIQGADVNIANCRQISPLHVAVSQGNKTLIDMLLEKGALVNIQDHDGKTPLSIAVWTMNVSVIWRLLEEEADPNLPAVDGLTTLHVAAFMGSADIATCLLQHGADIHLTTNTGKTALHFAALAKYDYMIELFLTWHANIDAQQHNGESALHIALYEMNEKLVKLLVDRGADINLLTTSGETPLHYAVKQGNEHIVLFLLNNGVKINGESCATKTPLFSSVPTQKPSIVLDHCADTKSQASNATHVLAVAAQHGNMDIVVALLEAGATDDVTRFDEPVKLAIDKHLSKQTLIQRSEVRLEPGTSALSHAARQNHTDLLHLFLRGGGVCFIVDEKGRTPLHWAAIHGNYHATHELLLRGSPVNLRDLDGNSPLSLAFKSSNRPQHNPPLEPPTHDVKVLLLQHGADPDTVNTSTLENLLLYMCYQHRYEYPLIIFKTLMYSGHDVKPILNKNFQDNLCALKEGVPPLVYEWLKDFTRSPQPLTGTCRRLLRRHLCRISKGVSIWNAVKQLPLPPKLANYTLLMDLT